MAAFDGRPYNPASVAQILSSLPTAILGSTEILCRPLAARQRICRPRRTGVLRGASC